MQLVKRTLVVAPHLGALEACASALTELTARRGRVHVAVHDEPPPGANVAAFSGKFRRLTFGTAPALDRWSDLNTTIRGALDCVRWLDPSSADVAAYRRALATAPPLAARLAQHWMIRTGIVRPLAVRTLRAIEHTLPPPPSIVEFLKAFQPDLLVVVPMFGIGSIAPDYLHAANALEIPTIGLPTRWDDLTSGALPHVLPDCVAVWNREQRRYAVDVLGIPVRRTAVVGGCLPLDSAGVISTSREEFCARHALDPSRAIVVLATDHATADRHPDRLRQWVEALGSSADARVRDASIVVYAPPPSGVEQREDTQAGRMLVPRSQIDPQRYVAEIAETLEHADVIVATDMTAVLEAAARAKPLVALLWPAEGNQALARFCADANPRTGWPLVARDLEQLRLSVETVMRDGLDVAGRAAIRMLVRPHGPDLKPGFMLWARLFHEVVDRRAASRSVSRWMRWLRVSLGPVATLAARRAAALPARREHPDFARVAIGVPSASSLFLHQPLLRTLAERGHQLRIVFTARTGQLEESYARIRCDLPGVVTAGLVPPPQDTWGNISRGLHAMSAYATMLDRRKPGQVPAWLVKLALSIVPPGARALARLARQGIIAAPRLRRLIARLDPAIPPSSEAREILRQLKPDTVLILPDSDILTAHESGASQADLIRASASFGIPVVTIGAAPDGQLHPASLQAGPSLVCVRSEEERRSVIRDLALADDRVIATGPAFLDRTLHDPPLVDAAEFRAMLGLPAGRPFAFFCGSVGVLSEPGREVALVRRWVAALRASRDPQLRELAVLIRPSVRTPRWRTLEFSGADNVVVCPRAYERSGELDAVLLSESVRYAAVTVGIDASRLDDGRVAREAGSRGVSRRHAAGRCRCHAAGVPVDDEGQPGRAGVDSRGAQREGPRGARLLGCRSDRGSDATGQPALLWIAVSPDSKRRGRRQRTIRTSRAISCGVVGSRVAPAAARHRGTRRAR